MGRQMREQEHDHLHRDDRRHPLPPWVRWFIALFVPFVVIVGTVLWIIQGAQAFIPLSVLTALGILIAFSQTLPWLFPSFKYEHSTTSSPQQQATKEINTHESKVDWGEAPYIDQFYGRERELDELEQWIVSDHCQMVAVLGMGGVGKTSLAAKLVEQIKNEFEYVFWRDLKNAPPVESIVKSCIQILSNQQRIDFPGNVDGQIALLIQYLREHRCLLVFDNVETVLLAGSPTGQYREGYEAYGRLISRIGETRHQSFLLLTGREKPQEVTHLEGDKSPARSYRLSGLRFADGREILKDKRLGGTEKTWEALIDYYAGNPLALKLVSQFIREVYNGDVAKFLKEGEMIFSDISDVLDQQFERLSELEREVMYWLAIEREAISLNDLQENIVSMFALFS